MPEKLRSKLMIFNFRPVPLILFGLVMGIISVTRTDFLKASVVIILAGTLFAVMLFLTDIKRGVLIAFAAAVFCGGLSAAATYQSYIDSAAGHTAVAISARVKGITYGFGAEGYESTIKRIYVDSIVADGEMLKGEAYFDNDQEDIGFVIGDEVVIQGDLILQGLDFEDSYSFSMFNDGIYYRIRVDSLGKGQNFLPKNTEKIRSEVYHKLKETLGERVAGFSYSMLFGDKSYLYPYDKLSFQNAGAAHVFAVSGLHVGVLSGIVIWLLSRLRARSGTILILCSLILVFYAYVAAFSPSVIRASIMVVIMLLAKAAGMRNDALTTVSITALMLLCVKPFWLFDVSFLLSFSAVYGIVLLYPPLQATFKKLKFFGKAIAINLAVNISILPFVLLFFGKFSLLTLPVNLIIIPLATMSYVLLLVHIFCVFALPFIAIFGAFVKVIGSFALDFVKKTSDVEGALVSAGVPIAAFIPYYCGIIIFSDYTLMPKSIKKAVGAIVLAAYCFVFLLSAD